MTLEEACHFLEVAEDDPHRVLWNLYLLTGVRRDEALALQWHDINWDQSTMAIRRTIHENYEIHRPKTAAGERLIALPPELLELLKEEKVVQDQRRKAIC